MRRRRAAVVAILALPILAAEQAPREVGLVERSTTRLAQIDVTVTGPPEVVEQLTEADFEVWINNRPVDRFIVDRVGREAGPVIPR